MPTTYDPVTDPSLLDDLNAVMGEASPGPSLLDDLNTVMSEEAGASSASASAPAPAPIPQPLSLGERLRQTASRGAGLGEYLTEILRTSAIPRAVMAGADQAKADILTTGFALAGDGEEAARQQRLGQVSESEAARYDQADPLVWDRGARALRGATRSVIPMVATAPLGAAAPIAAAVALRAGQGSVEADQAGLSGPDKWAYVTRTGAIEALPALVMQRLGLGGLEKNLATALGHGGGRTMGAVIKEGARDTLQEIPEELVTEIADNVNQKLSGIDPQALDGNTLKELIIDTTLQTVMMGGGATAVGAVRVRGERAEQDRQQAMQTTGEALAALDPSRAQLRAVPTRPDQRMRGMEQVADPTPESIAALLDQLAVQGRDTPPKVPEDSSGPLEVDLGEDNPRMLGSLARTDNSTPPTRMVPTVRQDDTTTDMVYGDPTLGTVPDAMATTDTTVRAVSGTAPTRLDPLAGLPDPDQVLATAVTEALPASVTAPTMQAVPAPAQKGEQHGQEERQQGRQELLSQPSDTIPTVPMRPVAGGPLDAEGGGERGSVQTAEAPSVPTVTPSSEPQTTAAIFKPGQRVRIIAGKRKNLSGHIAGVRTNGRLRVILDDGQEVGSTHGITPDNVEAIHEQNPSVPASSGGTTVQDRVETEQQPDAALVAARIGSVSTPQPSTPVATEPQPVISEDSRLRDIPDARKMVTDAQRGDLQAQQQAGEESQTTPASGSVPEVNQEPVQKPDRQEQLAGRLKTADMLSSRNQKKSDAAEITDVGEKIGGARKDRLTVADLEHMSDEERQTAVTKAAAWPALDHAAQIAKGQPPEVAHVVHQIRGAISAKPNLTKAEAADPQLRNAVIREYLERVGRIGNTLNQVRSMSEIKELFRREFPGFFHEGLIRSAAQHEQRDAELKRYQHIATSSTLAGIFQTNYKAVKRAKEAVSKGWPNAAAWHSRYEVRGNLRNGADGKPVERWYVRAKNETLRREEQGQDLTAWFDTKEQAEAEASRRYEGLVREGGGKPLVRPLNETLERIGEDRRAGKDVSAEDFAQTFGFRGIEFGNWTNQADRQQSINQAFDGLHDLAELMGIPPKALSLDGRLGMAFGARGGGRFAAHYEAGKVVINLTRTKGAGSLAHEWAHAVDNYFGKLGHAGRVGAWSSHDADNRSSAVDAAGKIGVRSEVIAAWKAVDDAIHAKGNEYLKSSRAKDAKRKGDLYWSAQHELFARAFETWAAQRLEDAGKSSPYLVQGVPTTAMSEALPEEWAQLYPQGADAERINAAIDGMVGTLKTEETERGTRLYQEDRIPGESRDVGPVFDHGSRERIAGSPMDRGTVAILNDPKRSAEAAAELFDYATEGTNHQRRSLIYGIASADDAERWSTPAITIQPGAWLMVDSDGIRHAYRQHGDEKTEQSRGQIAIDRDTFAEIAGTKAEEWSVIETGEDASKTPILVMENSHGTVVAEAVVRTGKRLVLRTAYKRKNPRLIPGEDGPLNSRASHGSAVQDTLGDTTITTKDAQANPEPGNGKLYQADRSPGEPLENVDRVPGAKEPGKRPAADEGIESLIGWALRDRAKTIEQMRERVRNTRDGAMRDEYRKTLDEYEGVEPDDLARHMREYPGHYVRAMSARGGNLAPVAVFRQQESLPPIEPRIQPLAMQEMAKDGTAVVPDLRTAIKDLEAALKKATTGAPIITVDRGEVGDAGGFYDPSSKAVVLKYHNDLDLVAHEVGHWVAENYDLVPGVGDQAKSDPASKAMREELARLAVHGSGTTSAQVRMQEGLAELVRAWMINRGEAELRAPHAVEALERQVPERVLAALRAYGAEVNRFEGASAVDKIGAGVKSTRQAAEDEKRRASPWRVAVRGALAIIGQGDHVTSRVGGKVPDKFEASLLTKLQFALTDKEAPQLANYVTSLSLAGVNPETLTPDNSWDYLRAQMRGQAGRLRGMVLEHGLANTDLTIAHDDGPNGTGDPLTIGWLVKAFAVPDANGELDLPSDFYHLIDRAHAYGTAQRTMELAARFEEEMNQRVAMFRTLDDAKGTKLAPDEKEAMAAMRRELGSYLGREKRSKDWELSADEFAAKERAILRKRMARMTAAGGGIHNATDVAKQALEQLANDPHRAEIEEYLRRYRVWSNWNLDYAVKSDLMTAEQRQRISVANEHYIDWHRVFSEDDDAPINIGEAVEGSMRTIQNPLASLLHATWSVVKRGDKNRLMQAYVAPLRVTPTKGAEQRSQAALGHTISDEEAKQAFQHQGYYGGGETKQKVYRIQRVVPLVDQHGKTVIDPYTGAPRQQVTTEHWVFASGTEASIEAMRSSASDNAWMTFMQGLNAMQRVCIVTAPSFRVKTLGRDSVERSIGTFNGNSVQQYVDVARGTVVDPVTGKTEDLAALFDLSGAGMAGWNQMGHERALAEVFDWLQQEQQQGRVVMTPKSLWRWWQRVGERVENVARKAEFAEAFRKARKSVEQGGKGFDRLNAALYAMKEARGLLDTAVSGRLVGQLNGFTLFFNAGVKGFERNTALARAAIKAARRGDMTTARKIGMVLVARVAAFAVLGMMLRAAYLASLDDDEKRKAALREPAWKKDFAWRFDLPGLGKVAIAKPYEMGWVLSGFDRLADHLYAKNRGWKADAERAWEGYGKSFVGAVLPIKPSEMVGGSVMPMLEVMMNANNFTGGSIIPRYESGLDVGLRKGTHTASGIGQALQAVTLDQVDARNLDHLIRGYFGNWGGMATSRSGGEFWRKTSGISGDTSPYASRDVEWVLDTADRIGKSSLAGVVALRKTLKNAGKATSEGERERLGRVAISQAERLRKVMEEAGMK